MQSSRWETINRIFEEAVLLAPEEQPAYLETATAGDHGLRAEVEAMLRADAAAGSFLEEPAFVPEEASAPASAGLHPGLVLAKRFQIRRFLAEGGMGQVYEALDLELGTVVALKLVHSEILPQPNWLERFRREVSLARLITHPNVCRTYDLGRAHCDGREVIFLTMELLDGVTLRQRLREEGPLSVEETLSITRQIASALEAAHLHGIVHRDVKPTNIMLVGDGPRGWRAVVMDFGLARPLQVPAGQGADPTLALSGLTQRGLPMGTLAYMAPEQIEGQPVTPATDTYALALVVLEMLSGRRTFQGDNLLSGLGERLRGKVAVDALLPPDAPSRWAAVFEQALQPDPAERDMTPRQLVEALERSPSRWKTATEAQPRKLLPALMAGAIAVSILALIGVSLLPSKARLSKTESRSPVAQGAFVYVAPVQNDGSQQHIEALDALLQATLVQSAQIRLLDTDHVDNTLRTMKKPIGKQIDTPTAREIAMRNGATRVIFPSMRRDGNNVVLDIRAEQPDQSPARARATWTHSVSWPATATGAEMSPAMLSAIREAGDWVRAKAGESAEDIARLDVPPEDATTANWAALDEYTRAEHAFAAGQRDEGINALERATRLDPQFAMAFARMGDELTSAGRLSQGLAAYRQAIITTDRQRLTRREMDRVRGMYASDTFDDATAEEQFRDLTAFYPEDWRAWFYRGGPLLGLGRTAEAVECLKRAWALHPDQGFIAFHLGFDMLIAGDIPQARSWAAALRQTGSQALAHELEGQIDAVEGKTDSAQDHFLAMGQGGGPEDIFWSALLLSHLKADEGKFREADEALAGGEQAIASSGNSGNLARLRLQRASLACTHGSDAACIPGLRAALLEDHSPEPLMLASAALADYGIHRTDADLTAAKKLIGEMRHELGPPEPGSLFEMARLQIEGTGALLEHRCPGAMEYFRGEDGLDNALDSRVYRAQAAAACAAWESDPRRAAALRQEAAESYAHIAFHPALGWFDTHLVSPGTAIDQLERWIEVAAPDETHQGEAHQRLSTMRHQTSFASAASGHTR